MSRPVHVRHVVDGASTAQGAVAVLGRYMVPQDRAGVNGRQGYQSGTNNRKLREESDFTITFPNTTGGDGVRHLDRFLILALRNQTADYKIGDEWLEVYDGDEPGGDLIALGTPIEYTITKTSIELSCKDAFITQTHSRETAGGLYWCHAPRDVFEHYTKAWRAWPYDDFAGWPAGPGPVIRNGAVWAIVGVSPSADGAAAVLGPNGQMSPTAAGTLDLSYLTNARYRSEVEITPTGMTLATETVQLVAGSFQLRIDGLGRVLCYGPSYSSVQAIAGFDPNTTHRLAIEGDRRWTYMYVDGRLVFVGSAATGGPTLGALIQTQGPLGGTWSVRVESVLGRALTPYLLRGSDVGDYCLPGALPAGGLLASYFSEVATTSNVAGTLHFELLKPTLAPYARRLDPTVNFAAPGALPNAWQAAGGPANGEKLSVRWTGAIYLDDPSTWLLRATATDRVRVWVGKTRFTEQIIDDWTNAGHAAMTTTTATTTLSALGTAAGWYPIIVEYANDTGVGGCVLEAQKSGGAWVVPGSTAAGAPALSPLGIFEDHVRGESHYTMLKQIADTFGYQFRCDPMQLESGEFPGRVAPRVRCGRDYDVTVTEDEDTSLQAQGSASDSVDTIVADAQGLADPAGATQLTGEMVNYAAVGSHLLVHTDAEPLPEISIEKVLLQRLTSLLALRSSPFEQVSAVVEREGGDRVLVPLPLSSAAAEIAWEPGDGVKRAYPSLGVEDSTYSQLTTVSRAFRPDALGLPGVSYKPRPRSWRAFFERLQRQIVSPQRNYQGQASTLSGSIGSNSAAAAPDNYSRVALPVNLSTVIAARLFVLTKSDTSAWNLEVNGTVSLSGVTVADTNGFDVMPWLGRFTPSEPLMHARLVSAGAGSTGTWQVVLVLTIRI